jgi:rhodanese-related sulfurtransferase
LKSKKIPLYYQLKHSKAQRKVETLKKTAVIVVLISMTPVSSVLAYTNLSPAGVHDRLVAGDTLLLLDVREASEYRNGHIAEPDGRLPLTPANMPWNSGILADEHARLPRTMDILVTCGSGGRSASASAFLESKGFTRVFNMTGGFSSWPYERRAGGFGDESGAWIRSGDPGPVGVVCPSADGAGGIIFPGGVSLGVDSIYVELHGAVAGQGIPSGSRESELSRAYRFTALDPFGLSLFDSDSLVLSAPASISLALKEAAGQAGSAAVYPGMACYVPAEGWRSVPFDLDGFTLFRESAVLRAWVAVSGSAPTAVMDRAPLGRLEVRAYPNPFNGSVHIDAPPGADLSIYDARGRLIEKLNSNLWIPDKAEGAGFYFIRIDAGDKTVTKRVLYLK